MKVNALKPNFIDKDPDIKLDAPVDTEIGDMPAWPYVSIPKQEKGSGYWTLSKNGMATSRKQPQIVKCIANSNGANAWASQ